MLNDRPPIPSLGQDDGTMYGKHPFKIERVAVSDPEYMSEVPERMKNKDFPGFPSCSVFVGMPGSGKSNCFMYMMLNPQFWFKFFDEIYLFGPTVKSDKLYELIKVPEDHICSDSKKMLEKLDEILEKQQKAVEGDKKEAMKVLCVFEDLTSFFHKVQSKPEFQRWYTQFRHLKGTAVSMVHKYKAFNRTARMCTQHILVWECNKTEIKQLYEDFGPPCLDENEWFDMVGYALTPTEDEPKPFFYINMTQPTPVRFRRCFTQILHLPQNAGLRGVPKKKRPQKRKKVVEEEEEVQERPKGKPRRLGDDVQIR